MFNNLPKDKYIGIAQETCEGQGKLNARLPGINLLLPFILFWASFPLLGMDRVLFE